MRDFLCVGPRLAGEFWPPSAHFCCRVRRRRTFCFQLDKGRRCRPIQRGEQHTWLFGFRNKEETDWCRCVLASCMLESCRLRAAGLRAAGLRAAGRRGCLTVDCGARWARASERNAEREARGAAIFVHQRSCNETDMSGPTGPRIQDAIFTPAADAVARDTGAGRKQGGFAFSSRRWRDRAGDIVQQITSRRQWWARLASWTPAHRRRCRVDCRHARARISPARARHPPTARDTTGKFLSIF